MRAWLIYTFLCAAALAAFAGLARHGDAPAPRLAAAAIDAAIERLLRTEPQSTVVPEVLFQGRERSVLLDPRVALPQTHLYDYAAIRAVAAACDAVPMGRPPEDPGLAKAWHWERLACGLDHEAVAAFFSTPPYMHPSGRSYVALALAKRPVPDRGWLQAHVQFMHVTELALWPDATAAVSEPVQKLARWPRTALVALVAGEAIIPLKDLVAVRSGDRASGVSSGPARYTIYPRKAWAAALDHFPYELVERRANTPCAFDAQKYFCWQVTPRDLQRESIFRILAMLAGGGLVLGIGGLGVMRTRERKRDDDHRKHILRTLTHELRTPVTSLALALEILRRDFDELPALSQEAFFRITSDVQRLNRIITGSAQYLRADTTEPGERLAVRTIPSIYEFLEATIEPYRSQVAVNVECADRAFRTDPFWLHVCLTNLTENALRHGTAPVVVSMQATLDGLVIAVTDSGPSGVARPQGNVLGLGLGLKIVSQAVRDLGGSLIVTAAPTKYTLRIPERP